MKDFLDNLPLTTAEREELTAAVSRRGSAYWTAAREDIKTLSESRKAEKIEKQLEHLLSDNKLLSIVVIDERLWSYIEELWVLGYSARAISRGLGHCVSARIIPQRLDPVDVRKRGQVIELLDSLDDFNLEDWRLKKQKTVGHGPKVTDEEKALFKELYAKGYSVAYIREVTGRSAKAIRKWVSV